MRLHRSLAPLTRRIVHGRVSRPRVHLAPARVQKERGRRDWNSNCEASFMFCAMVSIDFVNERKYIHLTDSGYLVGQGVPRLRMPGGFKVLHSSFPNPQSQ